MIVDANVLLYAVDTTSPFHDRAHAWLEDALNGADRVGLPWPSLLAFQRIITHPRVTTAPLTSTDAWEFVTDWLDADQVWVPVPGPRHRDILGGFLASDALRGNLVPDVHLAALAIENGTAVASFDGDFALFQGLTWTNPATAGSS